MGKKILIFAVCVSRIKSELSHSNVMEFHIMVSYMQDLCMPKLEYAHIRFWIQLTSGRRDCVSQWSSGSVVFITCNAQLKIVINKWQVKSQNKKCFSQRRCIMSFSCTYILPALQTTQSLDYIYSDHFLSCSKDTCSERHITPHLPFDLSQRSFLLML